MANFKIVARTLMTVIVVAFCAVTFHFYVEQGNAKAEELKPKLPNFEHNNNQQFLDNVVQCVYYIEHTTPDIHTVNLELLLAQAALESGWGNSRFAKEGKNLFGIRTYKLTEPHMLPSNNPKKWGVKVYQHECDSVKYYIDLLNNHSAYEKFRKLRLTTNDSMKLIKTLDKFSTTKDYDKRVIRMIKKIRKLEEKK